MQELLTLNHQDKFKSQRGGSNETIWCKREIPWPQNFILSGSTKSRVSNDYLYISQWVAGFSTIIREETDLATKIHMLEDVACDFGWQSAEGTHAALLCKMEEGKMNWEIHKKGSHSTCTQGARWCSG